MSDLERVIQQRLENSGNGSQLVGDWMLIYETQGVEDGEVTYSVGVDMANDSMPIHRILGLLDAAQIHYRSQVI